MSRPRYRVLWLGLILLAAALARPVDAAAPDFGTVTTVQVPAGEKARLAILGDVDGSPGNDLVFVSSVDNQASERVLRVFSRRSGEVTFGTKPVHEVRLTPDVVAVGTGDVLPDAGDEILLFFGRAVLAYRMNEPEKTRYTKLADIRFLWQIPHPRTVFDWSAAVRDIDLDGRPDLLIPEPDGYRILFQTQDAGRTHYERSAFVAIPQERASSDDLGYDPEGDRRRMEFRFDVASSSGELSEPFLRVYEALPYIEFVDWDADGDLDALSQSLTRMYVWLQTAPGKFAASPKHVFDLPIADGRGARLDISYRAHVLDVDADRRADYVMLAGDSQSTRKSKDPRTQVLVFSQAGTKKRAKGPLSDGNVLFGDSGIPAQLLKLSGFAGGSHFYDVDSDGLDDFIVGSLRLDLLDKLRDSMRDSVDTDLYVYRNLGGEFSSRPDLSHSLRLRVDDLGALGESVVARFIGDLTGDGSSEILLRPKPKEIVVHMVRKKKDSLQFIDKPLFTLEIDKDADLAIHQRGGATSELLVLEDSAVHHVRFR